MSDRERTGLTIDVDAELTVGKSHPDRLDRVHGVDSWRVRDASVMPTPIGGNTNAPTIIVAEKGNGLIRGAAVAAASPAG